MSKNLHRWKRSLDADHWQLLEKAAKTLEWAWKTDSQDPDSYPINTDYALDEIKGKIDSLRNPSKMRPDRASLPPPPPTSLSELIWEGTIKTVYEQQNDGRYEDALKQAAQWGENALSTWRRIRRAIDDAYQIDRYGSDVAPKPRIHFLHRNLLEIAKIVGLDDLTDPGMAEFLDDICPCSKTHKRDALRKLRGRIGR
jgi:hypothetical protein